MLSSICAAIFRDEALMWVGPRLSPQAPVTAGTGCDHSVGAWSSTAKWRGTAPNTRSSRPPSFGTRWAIAGHVCRALGWGPRFGVLLQSTESVIQLNMRSACPCLALVATLMAQEPPAIITLPPAQSPAFGAAALGASVTEVAQISLLFMSGTSPQKWYLTATVHRSGSIFYQGYTGEVISTGPGSYSIMSASAAELINVPPPPTDYFAFNASFDRKVLVYDSGGTSPPSVFVRASDVTGTPYRPFGSIGAPVPAGYVDSQIGDTITSWNGTTGTYEFIYIDGVDLKKVRMTLTTPSNVTLGVPVTIATSASTKHSPG